MTEADKSNEDRAREPAPAFSEKKYFGWPVSDAIVRYLNEEIVPWLERQVRALNEHRHDGLEEKAKL